MKKPVFKHDPLFDFIHDAVLNWDEDDPVPMPPGCSAVVVRHSPPNVIHRRSQTVVMAQSPAWPEPYEMYVPTNYCPPVGTKFEGSDKAFDHFTDKDTVIDDNGDYWGEDSEHCWYGPGDQIRDEPPAGERMSFLEFVYKSGAIAPQH